MSYLLVPLIACAADDPYAAQLFKLHCASCHEAAAASPGARIPPVSQLKAMTPTAILRTLESGIMKSQAAVLSTNERQAVANLLGTPLTTERKRDEIANPCLANAGWKEGPSWSGWGPGLANTRFQPAKEAGLRAEDVPKLTLKWAFAFPDSAVLRSQPAVYRGRVFAGSQDGSVYSLDAATGCVYWSTTVQAEVRSGITVAETGGKPALFFGDSSGNLYGLDATTGTQLWKTALDEHPASKGSSTPSFYQGRLYVGVSSLEEALAVAPGYVCCTFRGSVSAIQAADGKLLWKRYMITESAKPQPKSKNGSAVMGPSGVGVWTSPTLDPERDTMYVTTGDNYSDPPTSMSDSVVAMRMSTGDILWSKQLTSGDAWNSSCYLAGRVNCPDSDGPDFDFASSASLVSLANGKRALVVGQKSGIAYALDPDKQGQILWQSRIGKGGTVGGVEWGGATDGRSFYVALSDVGFQVALIPGTNDRQYELDPKQGGGIFAFRIDNGERLWQTPPPGCGNRRPCSPAQSAAITAIPGAVFSGSLDGHLRAYSAANGKIIWDYDTDRDFKTVNGLKGHGGALDVGGPIVAGGLLFVQSGSAQRNGLPGNVLLAFGR
ncbi:MAG: PQQ-binding-like beta-propeller repeat protein [Bryobacterales bacterium]|nr:PQQ-binding-like beta-propeller repeat protein [Bryobacterales bacterium]MBV9400024.1 PQQ-binding-like beta-propeller repeat protein [Bryobacterales bacterium]